MQFHILESLGSLLACRFRYASFGPARFFSSRRVATLFLLVFAAPVFAQSDENPTNLSATLVDGTVALRWDAPAADAASITGYQILRRRPGYDAAGEFHAVATTAATPTTYIDGSVEVGMSYTYRVKAWRGAVLSGWSNYVRIDVVSLPAPPNNLAATAGDGSVRLAWDDPDDDTIDGYQIRYAESGTDLPEWENIAGSHENTTGHTVEGLTNFTIYTIHVRAINEAGAGPGASVTALPYVLPSPPSNFRVAAEGDMSVSLMWDAPESETIDGYYLRFGEHDSTPPLWTTEPNVNPDATGVTVPDLINGTTYTFELVTSKLARPGYYVLSQTVRVNGTPTEPVCQITVSPIPDAMATVGEEMTPIQAHRGRRPAALYLFIR